jgi:Cytochrome b/b6/petB
MAPCSTPGEAQTFQISRLPPVDGPIAYRDFYRLLDGVTMSQAYQSVVAISLDVHGGLLIRQVHHWSADLFVAAICLRLLRAFFRGRFSGRALAGWLIWVVLLPLGMLAADSYCMISPIRGDLTGFRVQVPPRTHGVQVPRDTRPRIP